MKQCCICYEEYPELISLECNHEFCVNCVDSILNNSYSLKCALCRKHSYKINHKIFDKKILNVELYGPSYIKWELFLKNILKYYTSSLKRYYWYYGYKYPYTYHNPNVRTYKCKI